MPFEHSPIDPDFARVLDRVCQRHGFETREQAAEWLLRRRLARGLRSISMRGQPLHLIRDKDAK